MITMVKMINRSELNRLKENQRVCSNHLLMYDKLEDDRIYETLEKEKM